MEKAAKVVGIDTTAGILALLEEPEHEVKVFALKKLNGIVDVFWAEISDVVGNIEVLYEDETFKCRNLAALVASKVYYHLGAFEDSLTYALGADSLFDVNSTTEYVETIIAKCIDFYTKQRLANADGSDEEKKPIDPRLEAIVNRMFQRCFDDNMYKQAMGIALETRRIDVFTDAIVKATNMNEMLSYALKVCMALIQNRQFRNTVLRVLVQLYMDLPTPDYISVCQFRNTVLRVLVQLYMNLPTPDYISVCQCLIFLDDPQAVGEILEKLIRGGQEDSTLMAYQIAFDLYESATQQFLKRIQSATHQFLNRIQCDTQQFLNRIQDALRDTAPIPLPSAVIPVATPVKKEESKDSEESAMETDGEQKAEEGKDKESSSSGATEESSKAEEKKKEDEVEERSVESLSESDRALQDKVTKVHSILGGAESIALHLQFLIRTNKADLLILKNTKDAVRNSVCHNATVMANAFMHSGTTSDQFLRENLEWLSRATNWAKFTATASLGVMHRGHEKDAMHLMSTYLPKESGPGSAYSEGGGLYALGLIHANHGGEITEYLLSQLKEASTDIIRHGGCLGLGLAAMGTAREDIYEQLKFNLYQDDAVTGEAAGIAMGLVMLGTKSARAIEDMVGYAQETQHEKILRGLAVGIALVMYGRLEEADTLIESLTRDKDPILRWSGMYTVAMAYCGTANNAAIRKLLHVAVSDVNDDVRRAAVTSLGFLLFRTPEQCPNVVSLLSESYNPHVRYGAAMALGIACAGTGMKEAIALLEPMTNDPVNYVRQGALIASALILVQQNEVTCPKVKHYRELYAKVISDKHEDVMAKFGSILAQGIIDAGGRNCSVGLQSRTGHTNMMGVVGTLVFCQFWYWYPLAHFLSLAFTPTCIVMLNSDLKMPALDLRSGARPSVFAYVPPLEEKKDKKGEKVETAVLSITAKAKRKEAEKKSKGEADKMEVDDEKKDLDNEKEKKKEETKTAATTTDAKDKDKKPADDKDKDKESSTDEKEKDKKKEEEKKKVPEPSFEMLANPARVMKAQLRVLTLPDGRYKPVKNVSNGGIIMLKDCKHGEEQVIVENIAAGGPKKEEDEDEPEPPEPFEWTED